MDRPVAGPMSSAFPAPVAGLFGKLPSHGDFVRRGWSDETVDAVDQWVTEAIGRARDRLDDGRFADWMHAAPLWRGYVPAGRLGPQALHLGIAPSIDRAGRLFPIAIGIAGDDRAAWVHAMTCGQTVDAALYGALSGQNDADAAVEAVAGSWCGEGAGANGGEPPPLSCWWLSPDGPPVLRSDTVDAALLERLMDEGQA